MAYNEPGSLPPTPPPPGPAQPATSWSDVTPTRPPLPTAPPPFAPPTEPTTTWERAPQQQFTAPPATPSQPSSLFQATPPTPPKKKSRGVLNLLLAGLLVLGLLVGGIAIGRSLDNSSQATVTDTASATTETVDEPAVVVNDDAEAGAIEEVEASATTAPAPVSQIDDADFSDEPVAQVAAAVGPSVVLLKTDEGQGSGIIYSDDGVIVTNAHVVGDATEMSVTLPSGVQVPAEVLGLDTDTDIAVLQIDATKNEVIPATFAPDSSVQVGQLAVAIGSPFGLERTVTAGIISAINRPVSAEFEGETNSMLQTDAPINPGNSGGALADRQGRVVGMNTLIRTDGTAAGNIGVGFAIPADTMRFIADRLVAGEPVQSSFLGITGSDPLVGDPGAVVVSVFPDTPAARAGLQAGDRIVGFDGTTITSMSGLAAEVRLTQTDAPVGLTVVRDGEEIDFELQLITR